MTALLLISNCIICNKEMFLHKQNRTFKRIICYPDEGYHSFKLEIKNNIVQLYYIDILINDLSYWLYGDLKTKTTQLGPNYVDMPDNVIKINSFIDIKDYSNLDCYKAIGKKLLSLSMFS